MKPFAVIAIVGALAGCKSQAPEPPMDCSVIPPAVDRIMADRAQDPRVVGVIDRTKQELVALCTRDQWSAPTGRCIAKAADRAAMDQCRSGLKKEQAEHVKELNARLRGAIEEIVRRGSGAEAAESGSAAGSASGSGSATGSGGAAGSGSD